MSKFLKVESIEDVEESVWDNGGEKINVFKSKCEGTIDGKQSSFIIKTFHKPLADGFEGECESGEFRGETTWKAIKKAFGGGGGGGGFKKNFSKPSGGGGGSGGGGAGKNASFAASYAKDLTVAMINKGDKAGVEEMLLMADSIIKWLNENDK